MDLSGRALDRGCEQLRTVDPLWRQHYSALTGSAWNSALEPDPAPQRARQLVGAAISTFLHGYLPRS